MTGRRLVITVLTMTALGAGRVHAQTTQERVHDMSHHVMPFEMARTLHVFRMTETGGEQRVVVRDPADRDQVALIREHLRHEAGMFSRGNYADPARLHGDSMPGLAELRAGWEQVTVTYADHPDAGTLTFESRDLRLVTAIHRWFGAQLSEHGVDARAE